MYTDDRYSRLVINSPDVHVQAVRATKRCAKGYIQVLHYSLSKKGKPKSISRRLYPSKWILVRAPNLERKK